MHPLGSLQLQLLRGDVRWKVVKFLVIEAEADVDVPGNSNSTCSHLAATRSAVFQSCSRFLGSPGISTQ
eukprot:11525893-Karenia_brevis.AAC.1